MFLVSRNSQNIFSIYLIKLFFIRNNTGILKVIKTAKQAVAPNPPPNPLKIELKFKNKRVKTAPAIAIKK